jgi:hypothetical protein
MNAKKDYFYVGSYKSLQGLRAEGVKEQANGLFTILLCTGEVLVNVRRQSLFTREDAAEALLEEERGVAA